MKTRKIHNLAYIKSVDPWAGMNVLTAQEYAQMVWERQDAEAEIAAEMANERYFEDRGYEDARAQEAWEMSRGICEYI
jgi:hypothetical protein